MCSMLTGVGVSSAAASGPFAEADTQGKCHYQGHRHHRKSSAILWSIYYRHVFWTYVPWLLCLWQMYCMECSRTFCWHGHETHLLQIYDKAVMFVDRHQSWGWRCASKERDGHQWANGDALSQSLCDQPNGICYWTLRTAMVALFSCFKTCKKML